MAAAMLNRRTLFFSVIFGLALLVSVLARRSATQAIREEVARETGCPPERVSVRWRGAKSSTADVEACGHSRVYRDGFFRAPERLE